MRIRFWMLIIALLPAWGMPQAVDNDPQRFSDFELRLMSAETFLRRLCALPGEWPVMVHKPLSNWPRFSELPFLIARADDANACNSVMSGYSSLIGKGQSTVGREAKFLILGVRLCSYPPGLNSANAREQELEDALNWAKGVVARGESGNCGSN